MTKIRTAELKEYGLPYEGYDGVEVLQDSVTGNSRWSIYHEIIFRWIDGRTYRAEYSVGATEMQDERPWEYQSEVDCEEVAKVPVTKYEWQAVVDRGFHVYETEYPSEGSYCVNDAGVGGPGQSAA